MSDASRGTDLARRMARIAASLADPVDQHAGLQLIVDTAVRNVPGADHASISIRRGDGSLETLAASDDLIRELDEIQYTLREGPCYTVVTDQAHVAGESGGVDPGTGQAVVREGQHQIVITRDIRRQETW